MDFVEELFGIAPDGGSGASEFTLVVALAAAIFVAIIAVRPALRERIRGVFRRGACCLANGGWRRDTSGS